MTEVVIVDYGVGNLLSVSRALEHVGASVVLCAEPAQIAGARHLVLPGVGAFAHGMQRLVERGLAEPVKAHARAGKPLLGICLGMQMLLDESDEFGVHAGLGLIPGRVAAIPNTDIHGHRHRIPHIGWNKLMAPAGTSWDGTLFGDVHPGDAVYFVHSFAAIPANPAHILAQVDYNGRSVVAAVRSDSVAGCQFHPEKSGPVGLSVLRRFVESDV